MSDFATQRANMVDSQVRPNQVWDARILGAMLELPRELFVPASMRALAYMDEELCVELGDADQPPRALMAPMPLARLVQLVEVKPNDLVLDVGCATGYSTALLARLAESVVGLDANPALCQVASATLSELGADNAVVVTGPLTGGYPGEGPYDVILLGGSVGVIPDELFQQLKPGGRLVAIVRDGAVGRATLFTRCGGEMVSRSAFDCGAPALPAFERAPAFVF